MTTGTRKPGDFCWINVLTPQPDQARAFFHEVLDWNYVELPGMGHRVQVGGSDIGGLFDLESPNTPRGTPPLIGVMVKVESADATSEKVVALGGRTKPAFDILDHGRMAACFDPTGAEFDVWEPKKLQGTDADTLHHGAPSWFEALTTDPERAAAFYAGLFGWTAQPIRTAAPAFTLFKLAEAAIAGLLAITPEMGSPRPHWTPYFTVRDVDEAMRVAMGLGGTVRVSAQDAPGIGRYCGLASPQGVPFSVIAYAR